MSYASRAALDGNGILNFSDNLLNLQEHKSGKPVSLRPVTIEIISFQGNWRDILIDCPCPDAGDG